MKYLKHIKFHFFNHQEINVFSLSLNIYLQKGTDFDKISTFLSKISQNLIFIEYSFIVFFRQDDRSNLCLAIIKVNFEG